MKEKEFNLSEKRQDRKKVKPIYNTRFTYPAEDVKEFIKLLKEELSNPRMFDDAPLSVAQNVAEHIDKLAGKELI